MDLDSLKNQLFLTVNEAATACGCSFSTIRRMIKAGTLSPVTAFGADIRISVEQLKCLGHEYRHNNVPEENGVTCITCQDAIEHSHAPLETEFGWVCDECRRNNRLPLITEAPFQAMDDPFSDD
jgi:excisionase family DNA binding protein